MKRLIFILALAFVAAPLALAQNSDFPGVQKAMTPEQLAVHGHE